MQAKQEPEYQELKKEHFKDIFDKVFSDGYLLTVQCQYYNHYFEGGVVLDGEKNIIEGKGWHYTYEVFEKFMYSQPYDFEVFLVDENKKEIVIV